MTLFQKILINSFTEKSICILAKVFECKGISAFLSKKYLVTVVSMDCKDRLFTRWSSLSAMFPSVEKITQVSKALQHVKSEYLLASQIFYIERNIVFTWNRA